MDWVIVTLQVIIVIYLVVLSRDIAKLGVEVRKLRHEMEKWRVRQSKIKSRVANTGIPVVDATVRTIRRDTDDLPLTGRMSTGLHRKKRDFGTTNDDRL